MSATARTPTRRTVELRRLVLDEIVAISHHPIAGIDGWVRPYHVKYFRREQTQPELRQLSLGTIGRITRELWQAGELERRPREALYRPTEAP